MPSRRVSLLTTGSRVAYFVMIGFDVCILVLGALLVVACFVNPAAMGGAQARLYGAILALIVFAGGALLGRSLNSVATVEFAPDGDRLLRGAAGWRVARLRADEAAELVTRTSRVLFLMSPYMVQHATVTRARLRVDGRNRRMLPADPARYAELLRALGASPPDPAAIGAGERVHTVPRH